MTEPATPIAIDALTAAYTRYALAVVGGRPWRLQPLNSLEALQGRMADMEAHIIASKDFLKALVDDLAEHMPMHQRPDDLVEMCMADMASGLRALMVDALNEVAEDRRSVRIVR